MSAEHLGSMRRWLLQRLAIQTFLALSLVCVAVYYATNSNLTRRQEALIEQKVEVVRHVVEENAANGDSAVLRHKLNDFFYGRPEFTLVLEIDGARVVFGNPTESNPGRQRKFFSPCPTPARRATL